MLRNRKPLSVILPGNTIGTYRNDGVNRGAHPNQKDGSEVVVSDSYGLADEDHILTTPVGSLPTGGSALMGRLGDNRDDLCDRRGRSDDFLEIVDKASEVEIDTRDRVP